MLKARPPTRGGLMVCTQAGPSTWACPRTVQNQTAHHSPTANKPLLQNQSRTGRRNCLHLRTAIMDLNLLQQLSGKTIPDSLKSQFCIHDSYSVILKQECKRLLLFPPAPHSVFVVGARVCLCESLAPLPTTGLGYWKAVVLSSRNRLLVVQSNPKRNTRTR